MICSSPNKVCESQKICLNLAYLLIAINLTAFLWPVQMIEDDVTYHEYLLLITNYLNPLVLILYLCIFLAFKKRIYINNILYSSILYTILLIISSMNGSDPIKSIFIAIFFTLCNICMLCIYKYDYIKFPINVWITKILIFWASLPVILLSISDFQSLFIDSFENSFHGFASGRIEYGLWTTIAILLLITYRASFNKYLLHATLILMFTGLFLSQSRASFTALAICFIYMINVKYSNKFFKTIIFSITFVFLTLAMLSWEYFGRQNVFELLNSTRLEIYSNYFNQITAENILFGFGGQNSIILENGSVTQAHNLLIQWLSNWGIFGLLGLMLFLHFFWKSLDSIYPKMLLIALIFYSLTQPIQGTANFFGPLTLLCFFIIMGMQCDYASKKIIP